MRQVLLQKVHDTAFYLLSYNRYLYVLSQAEKRFKIENSFEFEGAVKYALF